MSISEQEGLKFGTVSGIGACFEAEINFYDVNTQKYYPKLLDGQLELISLLGNISKMNDKPFVHLHASLSDRNYNTYSGHLTRAIVSATVEITINMTDLEIERKRDEITGSNHLQL